MPRKYHKVVRQEVHWVDETRKLSLAEKPYRVWTLYLPEHSDKDITPTLPIRPLHNQNAFLEDQLHDWNWANGKLRYYSRVALDKVWILVEYAVETDQPPTFKCPECLVTTPDPANGGRFCPNCGKARQ
jgi:hypothetical protein